MDNQPFGSNKGRMGGSNGRRGIKNIGFVALVILIGLIIFAAYSQPSSLKEESLSTAITQTNQGQYSKIQVNGDELDITKKGDSSPSLDVIIEPNPSVKDLKDAGFDIGKVEINYKKQSSTGS